MSEKIKTDNSLDDLQTAAISAAAAVLVFAAVYWTIQIQGVMEMLELAYG